MGETEKALGGENRNGHFVVTLQNLRLFDCRNPLLFLWLQYFLLRFSLQQRCFIACHCHHLLLCREYLRAHFSVPTALFLPGDKGMPRQAQGCLT